MNNLFIESEAESFECLADIVKTYVSKISQVYTECCLQYSKKDGIDFAFQVSLYLLISCIVDILSS